MILRSVMLCLYLAFLYGISHQSDELRMLFYPTLGAFGFLFLIRSWKEMLRIVIAAVVAVTAGSVLFELSSGMISFFVTSLAAVILIQKLKINAAPVIAVSFIPFFAHPSGMWTAPLSVLVSLGGLLLVSVAAQRLDEIGQALIKMASAIRVKSSSFDVSE